jgi:hypothetical protein
MLSFPLDLAGNMRYVNPGSCAENESEHHNAMKYGVDEETKLNEWTSRVVSSLFLSGCFLGVK